MKKHLPFPPRAIGSVWLILVGTLFLAAPATAAPYHTPTVDGTIARDGTDWDPLDLVVLDATDDIVPATNVRRLLCTWDEQNLYFGLSYQDFPPTSALRVYVDLGLGAGPSDASQLPEFATSVAFPDGSIDLVLARDPSQGSGTDAPSAYRFLAADGSLEDITAQVTSAQTTGLDAKSTQFIIWNHAELAIPWEQLYPDLDGGVPPYAVLRAVALVASQDSGTLEWYAQDVAPNSVGTGIPGAAIELTDWHTSVLDADGDGRLDPSDGSAAGTVVLPQDDGSAAVTVTAELLESGGRAQGEILASRTAAAGVRDLEIGRLPTGRYELSFSAEGYFPASTVVDVTAGEVTAFEPVSLEAATAIRGTIGFASGPGGIGQVTLYGPTGIEVASKSFAAAGGSFVFYVAYSMTYTVEVTAATYLDASRAVPVQAGTDVAGVDFVLERQPAISGTVGFESGPGHGGTVRLYDSDGVQRGSADFPTNGGPFTFYTADPGEYKLTVEAATYLDTEQAVTVIEGQDVTGIALVLPRAPEVTGTLRFEGPASPGRVALYDEATGALVDTLAFAADGDTFSFFTDPGDYRVEIEASGYVPLATTLTTVLDPLPLGELELTAVRATRLLLVDSGEEEIEEVRATASDPIENQWFPVQVNLLAVDEAGRIDRFDLGGNLTDFRVSARKMDDVSAPTGVPTFYGSAALTDTSNVVDFADGRGSFWMTDTTVEVLRVYLAQPAKDPIAGRIVVAFLDPQPATVVLTADRDTLVADGVETITVTAALYDAGENESRIADIPVTFLVTDASSGAGQFEIASTTTNADGQATADLTARGAGSLIISASVSYNNRVLDVLSGSIEGDEETLRLTAIAGEAAAWELVLSGTLSPFDQPTDVTAQLTDAFGNPVSEDGHTVAFDVAPADFGAFEPASAATDTNGRATTAFVPNGQAGLVSISATGSGFAADGADLQLGDLFLFSDPIWYDEPSDHQTFEATDLTTVTLSNTLDELQIDVAFRSNWSDLLLTMIFEVKNDADGATVDPFAQPIRYGHALAPDYALTVKYSDFNYGDFRGWVSGGWQWWNPDTLEFQNDGYDIHGLWTAKGADTFTARLPWSALGGMPDSLRVEVYLSQETDTAKRSAFDSVPPDNTLNLDFDPADPGPTDWAETEDTVTLSQWSPTYVVKTDFPTPPEVSGVMIEPAAATAGDLITLRATVTDAGDGIGDVLADLSEMGGGALVRMYDDGDSGHGDATAGDGVYSLSTIVPVDNAGGAQTLTVNAYEAENLAFASGGAEIDVTAILEPILFVEDAIGDDHGPNQPGVPGLYYTYPTNLVFVAGAFDIESLTVFETRQIVSGSPVDMIAFQVKMGDFPDPADPGTADWNPSFADLNIQKLDIVIDSGPGGATASLPNRLAMFQTWDAWDYAIIMDGWFKALVPSLGLNTTDSWRSNALTTDSDIILRSDPVLDTVTALVSKEALGNPTAEQIRSWDIGVLMSSHDFGGEEVLGGIRWVNANRSEWQFGGGNRDDGKNVDANLMDLLMIPGTGKEPGRSQEELLDYTAPDAVDRYDAGRTAVALEMTALVDTGPPVIDTGGDGSAVTRVYPLADAPLALALDISDDYLVSEAVFRYRSTGYSGDGWDREVAMSDLGDDLWVVDIMPSWMDSNLVYSPIDSTRYIEFEVWARDGSVDEKESTSPVTTLQIWPTATCRERSGTLDREVSLLQQDGTQLVVPELLRRSLVATHFEAAWEGPEASPDTMGGAVELVWELCSTTHSAYNAPTVPKASPIGVFRDFYLATVDSLGGRLEQSGKLDRPLELSLHYPQAWVTGRDENKLALFRYYAESNRWTLVGGHTAPRGNTVTANVDETGTYGIFYADALDYDSGEVISGITISPNPFSPNGDGLYDETTISFYLTETASVTVEIYNIDGIRKQVLQDTFEYAGNELEGGAPRRAPGLIWDGTDIGGEPVPYGIYIMRVIAKYGTSGNERTVRSNHPLAVIK